ncbi:methyltransferase [Pseudohongiella nitratireducens]|uniref:Methyltransferase n=1 Tax=Pseudohongiella nitratireducens TaxID=1768907 RepID=A0A916QM75_9GAMM|nr:methyltransferase domain-containing protein [Pseudohongiella nitratireducens]GFZ80331.1 methyltransferase [Pseudohongiella nitratireducens]
MKKLISLVVVTMLLGTQAHAIDKASLNNQLDNPGRPAADKERDESRQPAEVLDFLGLEEGMTALDVMASGGWYTEVLSYAVGPNGKVLMQNSPRSLGMRNTEENVQARLAGDRLPNVERVNEDIDAMSVPDGSVDFAITALNFHDLYNSDPAAAQAMLAGVKDALKSGGILGVLDHRGNTGADNATLHRITLDEVAMALTEAGFHIVGVSDVLHNDSDDRTVGPFDPSLERNTDRLVVKAMKP